MDKKLEQKIIWTLAILLILIGLTGCIKPLTVISKPVEEKILITDSIANMGSIAEALGCLFAPHNPICQKEIKDKPISALTDAETEEVIED